MPTRPALVGVTSPPLSAHRLVTRACASALVRRIADQSPGSTRRTRAVTQLLVLDLVQPRDSSLPTLPPRAEGLVPLRVGAPMRMKASARPRGRFPQILGVVSSAQPSESLLKTHGAAASAPRRSAPRSHCPRSRGQVVPERRRWAPMMETRSRACRRRGRLVGRATCVPLCWGCATAWCARQGTSDSVASTSRRPPSAAAQSFAELVTSPRRQRRYFSWKAPARHRMACRLLSTSAHGVNQTRRRRRRLCGPSSCSAHAIAFRKSPRAT
mmetsp:Transcript_48018/g.133995  ORF Transcript_48018/g.133995 Transcript_48018/m.133995 type:complete len:270 (-) Transcript_48018:512-1321(-)